MHLSDFTSLHSSVKSLAFSYKEVLWTFYQLLTQSTRSKSSRNVFHNVLGFFTGLALFY